MEMERTYNGQKSFGEKKQKQVSQQVPVIPVLEGYEGGTQAGQLSNLSIKKFFSNLKN